MFCMLVCCVRGVTDVEELVHSSAPPTIVKNEQDIVVLYVSDLAQQ